MKNLMSTSGIKGETVRYDRDGNNYILNNPLTYDETTTTTETTTSTSNSSSTGDNKNKNYNNNVWLYYDYDKDHTTKNCAFSTNRDNISKLLELELELEMDDGNDNVVPARSSSTRTKNIETNKKHRIETQVR
jgi:hypothetical protein